MNAQALAADFLSEAKLLDIRGLQLELIVKGKGAFVSARHGWCRELRENHRSAGA